MPLPFACSTKVAPYGRHATGPVEDGNDTDVVVVEEVLREVIEVVDERFAELAFEVVTGIVVDGVLCAAVKVVVDVVIDVEDDKPINVVAEVVEPRELDER